MTANPSDTEMQLIAKLDTMFPTEEAILTEWANHWTKLTEFIALKLAKEKLL